MHDYILNINNETKISLDKLVNLGYNELIKNEVGDQLNPFILTEKEMELKKVLDKQVSLGYNGFIKNGIGSQPNLIRLEKKKIRTRKKVLDIELEFEYNRFIKSEGWFLAHHQ